MIKVLRSWLVPNPIIVKELRSRMRGGRAFITLTAVLVITAAALYGILQLMMAMSEYSTDIISPRIGQIMFSALVFMELAMICAITPAVTAGAISGEREKQTYELLQATPLSPAQILWGKLISALSYIFLLLFAAVPLASLVFIFGGVVPRDMLKALVMLLVLAVSFGVLGLFMSALFKRTGRATVASFVVVILLLFAPLFVAFAIGMVQQGGMPPRWVLAPSPISLLASTITTGSSVGGGIFDIIPIISGWWLNQALVPISSTSIPRPLYHYGIAFYSGLSLVLYLLAARLIQPGRRWRLNRREWITTVGLLLAFAALVTGIYLSTAGRYEWVEAPNTPTPQLLPGMEPLTTETTVVEVTVSAIEPLPDATFTPVPPGLMPAGATPTPTAWVQGMDPLPEAEQSEIWAAVARQLFTRDHTFGDQPPEFKAVYLLSATSDAAGDPQAQPNSTAISEQVQREMSEQLADLGAAVYWIPDMRAAPLDANTGQISGGGVLITLGNIHVQPDGTVQVPGSIYIASLAAGGTTYTLEKIDGSWQLTGSTGVSWIS